MRLDKFISNLWYGSRKHIANFIKDGYILVNNEIIYDKDFNINFWDIITIWNENINYKEFIYIILHKPSGYVSSPKDEWWHKSYLHLIKDCPYSDIINIVWRLDVDTEWLLLLTNDWSLIHKIISPKKDIYKKYFVRTEKNLTQKDIEKLKSWVKIDDFITKPALVEYINDNEIFLSISEWKFHQIKKMLETIWNKVIYLKRFNIWKLELQNLEIWKWRYLNDTEINNLLN